MWSNLNSINICSLSEIFQKFLIGLILHSKRHFCHELPKAKGVHLHAFRMFEVTFNKLYRAGLGFSPRKNFYTGANHWALLVFRNINMSLIFKKRHRALLILPTDGGSYREYHLLFGRPKGKVIDDNTILCQ